jgi:hypothetical protein
VYVDDLLCTCVSESTLKQLENDLRDKYKEVSVRTGSVHSYLGQTFDFSVEGSVSVSMEGYIYDFLELVKITGVMATPARNDLFEIDSESPPLTGAQKEEFHSRVAKLLYLAKRVRPDILMVVNFLSTRVQCSTEQDWSKLDRVLGYLNGSADLGIVLDASTVLQVFASIDASYAVHADFKSQTGE